MSHIYVPIYIYIYRYLFIHMYVETGIAYCKHISPPGSSSPGDLFETTSGIYIGYPPSFKHKIISYWA